MKLSNDWFTQKITSDFEVKSVNLRVLRTGGYIEKSFFAAQTILLFVREVLS